MSNSIPPEKHKPNDEDPRDEDPRLARDVVPDEGEDDDYPYHDDPDLWPELYESDLFTDEERKRMGKGGVE